MTGIREQIKMLGMDVDDGVTVRTVCPACDGGSTNERSLSLTREGETILYNCFRAACGLHGAVGGTRLVRTRLPRKVEVHPYTGELYPPDDEWLEFLHDRQGFEEYHMDVSGVMIAEEGRCAYPIYDPMGRRRGYVLRSYDHRKPKALTRKDRAEPTLSWYLRHGTEYVLAVEDIPSAVRASKYVDSVALIGTGVSPDALQELAAHRRNIVWALDADATEQAIKMNRQHGVFFDSSRVMQLTKDLKDMTEEELVCTIT